ncbi:MAG: hypothetical protein PHH98_00595 [Candidatus Gracilibacteria bacterium]|nr:hypothetical protein [Candidatus Gracilibacteria bacterium]
MSLSNKKFGNRAEAVRKAGSVAEKQIFGFMQHLVSIGKTCSIEMQVASLDFAGLRKERRRKGVVRIAKAYT